MASICISLVVFFMVAIHCPILMMADKKDIGVCYGMEGDDFPPAFDVVALYKRYGIGKIRLYYPDTAALEALRGSDIEVTLGVRNKDIPNIASSENAANSWFATHMEPYINDVNFIFVVVGNDVFQRGYASCIVPAMQNLLTVLLNHNLQGIRVTTSIGMGVLQNTYPPSASEFRPEAYDTLMGILNFLSGQGASVLMVNVYPYFAYATDPAHISLDYAQFRAILPVFSDGNLDYYNLFDAMVDAVYWAMEKAGFPTISVAVSESGWPSAGNGDFTTPDLALVYNMNFMEHILSKTGTPKRPGGYTEAFIYALFNENCKPAGVGQHWGLFYPNMEPVYPIFSSSD